MTTQEAKGVAEAALTTVDSSVGDTYSYVGHGSTVVAGRDSHGYWVADNGDEVNGLNRRECKRILTAAIVAA
jgi:hypothetical protein